jgi:hypothetical protein
VNVLLNNLLVRARSTRSTSRAAANENAIDIEGGLPEHVDLVDAVGTWAPRLCGAFSASSRLQLADDSATD